MASFATKPERPEQPSKPSNSGGGGGGKGSRPPKASSKPKQPEPRSSGTFVLIGAFVAMAVVAVVVAMLVSGGDDKTNDDKGVSQTQPISVTGNLPVLDGDSDDGAGGAATPVITGKTFAGSEVVSPVAGQPTMIAFVAHWCPHCQKEVPLITKWASEGGLKDVQLVAVATATDKNQVNYPPSAWLTREQWPGKVIADDAKGTANTAFGVKGYPTLVFIDAEGKVRARLSGEQPVEALDAAIAKITTPSKG